MNLLINDDCFEGFKQIKKYSLDLICVDLPYGATELEWDKKIDLDKMWKKLKKISKPNALYIFFCNSKLGSELMNSNLSGFKYELIYEKSFTSNFLSCNKRPLCSHELIYIFKQEERYPDKQKENNLEERKYSKIVKQYINESQKKIDEKMGNMGTHHFFNDSQFGIPTKTNYEKLSNIYNLQNMSDYKTYEELKKNFSMSNVYKYNPQMVSGTPYKSKACEALLPTTKIMKNEIINTGTRHPRSILKYTYDKNKIHPTQKPVELLKFLIKSYTNEGDIVLDFCMGSGSTIIACLETGRNYIGIEKYKYFFDEASKRIEEYKKGNKYYTSVKNDEKKFNYI